MKQTDNRQKQQIQLRAEKTKLGKHIHESKHKSDASHSHDQDETGGHRQGLPAEPFHAAPKIGRNNACPCGSGKKYKKCCLEKQ